jgi:molybdenum cofactor cytidylyltransferase
VSNRIAAVVLAAGMSRRMGRPKALLPLGRMSMIVRVVEPLLEIGSIDPIIIVTGSHAEQVTGAMDGCTVEFAQNWDYQLGMLSSVKVGCRAVRDRCDGFLLLLGDQPLVRTSTLLQLLHRDMGLRPMLDRSHGPEARVTMVQPCYRGRRGHPLLFTADCIESILALPEDQTLKTFTQTIDASFIGVDDPGVVTDIDTPEDYELALQQFRSELCTQKA